MADDKPVVTDSNEYTPEDRQRSFIDILREQATTRLEEKPQEPSDEEKKKEEEKAKQDAEEAKKLEEEAQRKHDAEVAEKAAAEVLTKQRAEAEKEEEKAKAEDAEKKRQEELKPKYTGKDKDGNVVPLSYEELNAEAVRIAKETAKEEMRQELAAEREKVKQAEIAQSQNEEQKKAAIKSYEAEIQKELDSDLKDLYAGGKLPKITNIEDPNDEGNKEFKNLFETAQKVNGERIKQGLPPIRSIKLIYYEHYKPLSNPAGHNAPVMGQESTFSQEAPEDQYVPSRDRHKSMSEMVKEEAQRLTRKINIRGN